MMNAWTWPKSWTDALMQTSEARCVQLRNALALLGLNGNLCTALRPHLD